MNRFLFAALVALAMCFSSTADAGTLGDTITVTSAVPVDHFEVRVKETSGFLVIAVSDPADDPDSDGDIEVAATANGTTGSISISKFLTGQPTGAYKIEAIAVDVNGEESPWAVENFTYSAPAAPTITVGFLYTNSPTEILPGDYAILNRRSRLVA